jgi:hypothetical protein
VDRVRKILEYLVVNARGDARSPKRRKCEHSKKENLEDWSLRSKAEKVKHEILHCKIWMTIQLGDRFLPDFSRTETPGMILNLSSQSYPVSPACIHRSTHSDLKNERLMAGKNTNECGV